MLCRLPLESGSVFAFLPPTVTAWDLLHFEWPVNSRGDLGANRVDWEYLDKQRDLVASFLVEGPGNVAFLYCDTLPPGRKVDIVKNEGLRSCLFEVLHKQTGEGRIASIERYFLMKGPPSKGESSRRAAIRGTNQSNWCTGPNSAAL